MVESTNIMTCCMIYVAIQCCMTYVLIMNLTLSKKLSEEISCSAFKGSICFSSLSYSSTFDLLPVLPFSYPTAGCHFRN